MVYYIPEFLKDQQIKHDAPFWKVFDGTKMLDQQLEVLPVSKSSEILQQFLDETNGDFVTVKLYQTKPEFKTEGVNTRNCFEYRVKLKNTHGISGVNLPVPVSNTPQITFADQLALYDRIHQMEIEKIKAEYENQDTTPSFQERLSEQVLESGFIGLFSNWAGSKMFGNMNKPINTAINTPTINGESDAEQKFRELQIGEKEKIVLANYLKENPLYLNMILEAAKK
jgi:hypothetical protein